MSTTAILLVLLSAGLHAGRDFLTKQAGDKQAFVWWYQTVGLAFLAPLFVYFALTEPVDVPLALGLGVFSGGIYFLYWLFLAKAYEDGDLSRVYPVVRSAPALILLFGVLVLNEQVSWIGGAGVLLTVLGVYTINMRGLSPGHVFAPLTSALSDRAMRFALLTLLSVTAYSIVDKLAVGRIHPVVYLFLLSCCGSAFFTVYVLKAKGPGALRREWRANRKRILINGVLVHYGYLLILFAFAMERLSYVVGFRQLSVVFAVLLGGHVLAEEHRAIRFTSALIIVVGAFLIAGAG